MKIPVADEREAAEGLRVFCCGEREREREPKSRWFYRDERERQREERESFA